MMQKRPFLSIVIPTYNRPKQLATCLEACSRLDYPHDRYEVIVVDDGGVEPLDNVINRFHSRLRLKLLRQENAGPAAARNRGASGAGGEFLAFTDDDCVPAPDWLETLAARFVSWPNCAVGGGTFNALAHNRYATASQLLISYLITYYGSVPGRAQFFPSCNLAFPTKWFRDIGGFDVSFPRSAGEDRELCDRWQQRGHQMIYAPEARVFHAHHLTVTTFFRQHFHYGCGAFHYHFLRSRQRRQPMRIEPFPFYVNMLIYPFKIIPFGKAMRIAPLLIASQVVNAAGYFWERAKGKKFPTGSSYVTAGADGRS